MTKAVREFPLDFSQLVGKLTEALLQCLDLLPEAASQLLVRLGAQILLLPHLAGYRLQLLLDRGLHACRSCGTTQFKSRNFCWKRSSSTENRLS
jgi:hypothetical protein